jgi:hypothetical protein
MKWVTFISCLCLLSFAESKHLSRATRESEHVNTIKRAAILSPEHLEEITLTLYAQFVQKGTFEEVHKLVEDTIALSKKCIADEHSDPECLKPLSTVLLDEICHEAGIAEKHGFAACCAKADPERHECFLLHKNGSKNYIEPYHKPSPEDACKRFHDNAHEILNHYIYEVARRYPFTKVITIIHGAERYEKVLTTCCQAEDKPACFADKATAAKKDLLKEIVLEKHYCSILKKFTTRGLHALKLSQISQKFPKASFDTAVKISRDVVHIYEECCIGDTLDCLLDREKLATDICSHQDTVASNLKDCCAKPLLERGECISHVENDEKPADLPTAAREFIDDPAVCQHYTEDRDLHLGKFLYQYSRIHDELPAVLILRISRGYEEQLQKCCPNEHPETCLAEGEAQIKKYIDDSKALLKTNCDHYTQLGRYLFQNELIVRYAKRAPQLSPDHLRELTKKLVDVAAECCSKDEAHKVWCAETHLDVALGYLCYLHEEHPINKQVCKCCGDSYAKRRECISGLGLDPEYVPKPFDPEVVTFHEDYCSAEQQEQERKKQTVLVHLLQHKPDITDEQLATAIVGFTGVVTTCCEAEKKGECFATETPKLIENTKAALGEH